MAVVITVRELLGEAGNVITGVADEATNPLEAICVVSIIENIAVAIGEVEPFCKLAVDQIVVPNFSNIKYLDCTYGRVCNEVLSI